MSPMGKKLMGMWIAVILCLSPMVSVKAADPEPQGSLGDQVKLGDLDNDGEISPGDVVCGLRILKGSCGSTTLSQKAGDLNKDGVLSVQDLLLLLQNVLHLRTDSLGISNLPQVTYEIPEMYQKGSGFLKEEKVVGFYGADGYGKYTSGGRGGRVMQVTNLNDSGEGSLRAAIEAKGPRIIVFRVSGNIPLESVLCLKNGDVTIAGETAPGDGITLVNYPLSIENCQNVIIRYMNFRSGDYVQAMDLYEGEEYGYDSLTVTACKDVIIDHCTAAWGTDETLSVTVDGRDTYEQTSDKVSVQWSVISESLVNSANVGRRLGLGSLIYGTNGSRYSFHHNLYACHASRMPDVGNQNDYRKDQGNFEYEFVNNVVYGWKGRTPGKSSDTDGEGEVIAISRYDFINNYYVTGKTGEAYIMDECSFGNQMYLAGNFMNGQAVEDQTSLVYFGDDILPTNDNPYFRTKGLYLDRATLMYKGSDAFQYGYLKDGAFEDSLLAGVQPAEEAYRQVLEKAGNSLSRDSLDLGLMEGVENKTIAAIDYPYQSAGWPNGKPDVNRGEAYGRWLSENYPNMASYEPYEDTDGDGMSDRWETFMGLDQNDPGDGAETYLDSQYTNLDVFLQFLVENPAAAIDR